MRIIHKGAHPNLTSGKNKRIKSLQITSSHTGKTVAAPAYNRAHPMRFATLLTVLTNHLTWVKPAEKPRRLTLAQALKVTLLSYRQNIT
ncbi:hypothetical protein GCM10007359_21700 [Rothia aerolata]|uniref:Uncharacterized protein n=1 Tax=Rothia aerolata TaxID=1812262 RepID=A0A917IYE4_9MICC|nr:hypothetical protein GCM10007359_21700 [Rothia aerolata]